MKNHTLPTGYLLKRFMPYFSSYKKIFIFDLICAAFTSVCDLVLPVIIRFITNTVSYHPADLTINMVVRLSALYLVLRGVDVLSNYYMQNTGRNGRADRDGHAAGPVPSLPGTVLLLLQ